MVTTLLEKTSEHLYGKLWSCEIVEGNVVRGGNPLLLASLGVLDRMPQTSANFFKCHAICKI